MGWQKCNVDAGFHQSLNKTSVGWCLRDHLGNFMVQVQLGKKEIVIL
jgi:hypothetical protein